MQELLEGETANIGVKKCYYVPATLIIITLFFMGIVSFKNGWLRRYRF